MVLSLPMMKMRGSKVKMSIQDSNKQINTVIQARLAGQASPFLLFVLRFWFALRIKQGCIKNILI
jgi:hypothetical protein